MLLVILYSQVLSGILVSGDRVILFVCFFVYILHEVKCKYIRIYIDIDIDIDIDMHIKALLGAKYEITVITIILCLLFDMIIHLNCSNEYVSKQHHINDPLS